MAMVREPWVFFVVAGLAGVGWTLSASELWVAAQRAMPSWVRGRMSATVMMVSQGAMAVGGLIWGSAVTTAGPAYSLLAAAALLLVSLVLAGPLYRSRRTRHRCDTSRRRRTVRPSPRGACSSRGWTCPT